VGGWVATEGAGAAAARLIEHSRPWSDTGSPAAAAAAASTGGGAEAEQRKRLQSWAVARWLLDRINARLGMLRGDAARRHAVHMQDTAAVAVQGSVGVGVGGGGGGESFMCVYWVAVPKAMRARRANRRRRRRRRAIGSRRSPRARSCCAAAAEGPNSSCLQPSARGLPPPAARGAISGGDRWAQVGVMIGSPCLGLCTHCDPMASLKTVMLPWS
jgi:hypothetical protein